MSCGRTILKKYVSAPRQNERPPTRQWNPSRAAASSSTLSCLVLAIAFITFHPSTYSEPYSIMKTALITLLLSLTSAAAFTAPSHPSISAGRLYSAATTEDAAAATTFTSGKDISSQTAGRQVIYTSEQIDELLPHRYPFALVDKVVEYEAGKRAVGIKSVTKVREIDEKEQIDETKRYRLDSHVSFSFASTFRMRSSLTDTSQADRKFVSKSFV
jgi:hypothetical protein